MQRRVSVGGSRGHGRRTRGAGASSPSPLGRSSGRGSAVASGTSTPLNPITVEVDDDSSSSKKRRWNSPVWNHYIIKEGKHFSDGKDRAYCKYCNGGPIDADSSNGTSNFRRHTESCSARSSTDVGQLMMAKDGQLARKFSRFEYKELVAQAIIRHGYTYTFAEHEGNRTIHVYLNENCVPISRNTAKSHSLKIHKREKQRLMTSLGVLTSRICITSDLWTSCVGHGFLSLTAHYIDANWNLHSKILNFIHMPPPHNANALHDKIHDLLKEWKIHKKIFTITLDNARANDNMQDILCDTLNMHARLPCGGEFFHVRCGAHVLNLIVKEGLKLIDGGTSKVKDLVKYVTGSEGRKMKFEEIALGLGIDCARGLWLDCPTRWNSTYKMLQRALPYRAAFTSMRWMERSASTFPDLPTDEEWSRIEEICDLLQPFDEITTIISGTKYPTANLYLKNVWKIESLLLSWTSSEDIVLRGIATKMRGKFKDYWDNYSMILSFAAILDPRYKFQFVMYCFRTLDPETSDLKSKIVKDQLYKLFGEYVKEKPQANYSGVRRGKDDLEGFANFDNVGLSNRQTSELDNYLDEYRLDHTIDLDVLNWWKQNRNRFPCLSNMARDVLSIPITTVASESCFSMGGRILTKWRASLKPENAEALVTTRSWLFGYKIDGDEDDQELNGACVQFSKVTLNVDEEVEVDEEEEEEVGLEMGDQTEFGDSSMS